MRSRVQCALILLAMLPAATLHAQVFRVQGGESTLLNAEGGSVEVKAPDYNGTVGLGFYNGRFEYGADTRYQYRGYTVLAGDESIPFTLPTDIFDASHYFSARGLGAMHSDENSRSYIFAGSTSTWLGTGFFNAASSDRPAGIFFYERKWNSLKFFSRDIVSNTQTSLQGVEWQARKWVKAALAGGIGSNQKYLASSVDVETQKLAFKASYVLAGDQFHRVTVISPLSSEVNKGNVQMLYKPNHFVSITNGHENILEPLTVGAPMQQASVNQFSADFHVQRFYFGSGLFSSNASGRKTQGTNFYLGRRFNQRVEVNANYFDSKPQPQSASQASPSPATVILSGTVRENLSSRFSLLQLISRTAGQTTYAFGGDFTSNRLQLRADYQNVYLPFRPDRPFEQALALNVALRVHGPLLVTAASNVDPTGHLRYSFGASTYLYRLRGIAVNAVSQNTFSIARYVVRGVVVDDQWLPVEGAALRIGREIAHTDSAGHFQVRFSKHGPFALSVVPEEFLTNAAYESVSAPTEVQAETDDAATKIKVVVRHRAALK